MRATLSSIMPSLRPVCMASGIWCVLPSRMFAATDGVTSRTSSAAMRPWPSRHLSHARPGRLLEGEAAVLLDDRPRDLVELVDVGEERDDRRVGGAALAARDAREDHAPGLARSE